MEATKGHARGTHTGHLGPGRSGEPSIPVIHKTPGLAPCQVFASALAAPFTVKALLFGAADAQGLQLRGSPA